MPAGEEFASRMWSHAPTRKSGRARRRVKDRLPDPGIDKLDQGTDDMARRAKLAEFTRLPDLAQHMLEQVAFRVCVYPVKMQVVQLADNLGEHRRLVDHQPRAVHEVRNASGRKLGMKTERLPPSPSSPAARR